MLESHPRGGSWEWCYIMHVEIPSAEALACHRDVQQRTEDILAHSQDEEKVNDRNVFLKTCDCGLHFK